MEIIDAGGNLSAEEIQRRLNGQPASVPVTVKSPKTFTPPASAPAAAGMPTKTQQYKLILTQPVTNKVSSIKQVREITRLGLKEAKDLVDLVEAGHTPTLKDYLTIHEAADLQRKFMSVGQGSVRVVQ